MGAISSVPDLVHALRRRVWMIVMIALLGVPVALWFANNQPRLYEATAVIQIEIPQIAETVTGVAGAMAPDGQLNLIQQQLMARDTLLGVIESYGLFPMVGSVTEKVALLRGAVAITRLQDSALAWRPEIHPTGLMVTVRLDDPVVAADVANEMINRIITESTLRGADRANRTLEFILAEEARVAGAIAEVESRIASFREVNVDALPEGLTAQRDRLTRLSEQRLAVDEEILALQSGAERQRAEEVARQDALLQQRRNIVLQAIAETEAAIAAAPEVERQLGAMDRELTQLEAELEVLTARRTDAAMTQQLELQNQSERYVVLETAIPPEFPTTASRRKVAATVAAGVAAAGIALALALEVLNPAIRTTAQLERQLGVQPVIVVPYLTTPKDRRGRLGWWLGLFAALGGTLWLLFRGQFQAVFGASRAAPAVATVVAGSKSAKRAPRR
jgi:tyrosine-protein kinase Etk/Wzc